MCLAYLDIHLDLLLHAKGLELLPNCIRKALFELPHTDNAVMVVFLEF